MYLDYQVIDPLEFTVPREKKIMRAYLRYDHVFINSCMYPASRVASEFELRLRLTRNSKWTAFLNNNLNIGLANISQKYFILYIALPLRLSIP